MDASLILRVSAPLMLWVPVAASLYLLIRGHNDPGGGFVGGLVASAGVVFYAISRGQAAALRALRLPPAAWCGIGLLVAAGSGIPAWIDPEAGFLTHRWWFPDVGFKLPIGTALLFDIGVYLVVVGTVTAILLALVSED